jgi:hypothetical protein
MENNAESVSQPFGDEAKFFTEIRLLQQDVEIILESVNNNNFVGSIIHPVQLHFYTPILLSLPHCYKILQCRLGPLVLELDPSISVKDQP